MAAEKQVLKYDCATVNNLLDTVNENKDLFPFDDTLNIVSKKGLSNSVITKEINKIKDATSNNKGYFLTFESLKLAYPNAEEGNKAYVGNNYPYKIYLYESAKGGWYDTEEIGGDDAFNAGEFYTRTEIDQQHEAINNEIARVEKGANYEVLEYEVNIATTRLKVSEENRKGGYMITYNAGTGWIKEQYIGELTTNEEWIKDENWKAEVLDENIQAIAENAQKQADLAAANAVTAREQAEYANQRAAEANAAALNVTSAVIDTLPVGTIMLSSIGNIFGENWRASTGLTPTTYEKYTIKSLSGAVFGAMLYKLNSPKYCAVINLDFFTSEDLRIWKEEGSITLLNPDETCYMLGVVNPIGVNDKYIAIGLSFNAVDNDLKYLTSSNGFDWQEESYPFGEDVAAGLAKSNLFYGCITINNAFYYKSASSSWEKEGLPLTLDMVGSDLVFLGVESKNDILFRYFILIHGANIAVRKAYNGYGWEKKNDIIEIPSGGEVSKTYAAFNDTTNTLMVTINWRDSSYVWYTNVLITTDFENWEDITLNIPEIDTVGGIACSNGVFAISLVDSVVYSADGINWTKGSRPDINLRNFYSFEDKLVQLSENGEVAIADAPINAPNIPYGYIKFK